MPTISAIPPATIASADVRASRAEDDDDAGSLAFGQELVLMMMPDAAKPAAADGAASDTASSPTETPGALDATQIVDSLIAPTSVLPDSLIAYASVLPGGNVPGGANDLPDSHALVDPDALGGAIPPTGAAIVTDNAAPAQMLRATVARDAAALALATPLASQTGARAGESRLAPSQTAEMLRDTAETLDRETLGAHVMHDPREAFALREGDGRGLRRATPVSEQAPVDPLVTAFGAGPAASTEPALSSAEAAAPLDTLSAALTARWMPAARAADAAHAPATARVDTPFGADGWTDAFQQKIVWLVDRQQQSAELHLNPPNLGPVEVVLSMSNDRANIIFVSPHAAVRDAIEASLADLRTALGERGLAMGDALVSADAGSAREQAQREAAQAGRHARGGSAALPADMPGDAPRARTTLLGLVDTFA